LRQSFAEIHKPVQTGLHFSTPEKALLKKMTTRHFCLSWLRLLTLLPLLAAAACVHHRAATPGGDDTVVISVIGTNDVHGKFLPAPQRGGIVTFSGYVAALRQARAHDGGVLLVDGGDMWQGTLESNLNEGALMVEAYNALGYAAATIGNHEFDFGPAGPAAIPGTPGDDPRGNLKLRASEADFPLLAANLIDERTGDVVSWDNVRPSTMVEVAGVRIGIIGLLTDSTLVTTIPANVGGLRIGPLADAVRREATALRQAGATLVVVTAHAGASCEDVSDPQDLSSCDMTGEILEVAASLPRGLVNHIVGGHEGGNVAHVVNGTAVTVGLSYTRTFGRADFTIDRARGRVLDVTVHPPQQPCPYRDADSGDCAWSAEAGGNLVPATYEGAPVAPTPAIESVAKRAAEAADAIKSEQLGVTLESPFTLEGNPESPLANLVTDALYESLDVDVALMNVTGGLRTDLPAGPLTYGSVYEMFPFDNRVVLLDITGADLRRIVAAQTHNHLRRAGFAGMTVEVSCTDDELSITMRLDDGHVVADDDRVRIGVNDFLAMGGDSLLTPAMPDGGYSWTEDSRFVRDVIADWLRRRGGSMHAADFGDETGRRWSLPETLPATCSL